MRRGALARSGHWLWTLVCLGVASWSASVLVERWSWHGNRASVGVAVGVALGLVARALPPRSATVSALAAAAGVLWSVALALAVLPWVGPIARSLVRGRGGATA
jgi:hypothetical protein